MSYFNSRFIQSIIIIYRSDYSFRPIPNGSKHHYPNFIQFIIHSLILAFQLDYHYFIDITIILNPFIPVITVITVVNCIIVIIINLSFLKSLTIIVIIIVIVIIRVASPF